MTPCREQFAQLRIARHLFLVLPLLLLQGQSLVADHPAKRRMSRFWRPLGRSSYFHACSRFTEEKGFLVSLVFAKASHTSVGEDREKGKWVRALHPRPEGRGFPRSLVKDRYRNGQKTLT